MTVILAPPLLLVKENLAKFFPDGRHFVYSRTRGHRAELWVCHNYKPKEQWHHVVAARAYVIHSKLAYVAYCTCICNVQ